MTAPDRRDGDNVLVFPETVNLFLNNSSWSDFGSASKDFTPRIPRRNNATPEKRMVPRRRASMIETSSRTNDFFHNSREDVFGSDVMAADPWVDFQDEFGMSQHGKDDSFNASDMMSDSSEYDEERFVADFSSEESSNGETGTMPLNDRPVFSRGRQGGRGPRTRSSSNGDDKRRNRSRSKPSFVANRRTRSLSVPKKDPIVSEKKSSSSHSRNKASGEAVPAKGKKSRSEEKSKKVKSDKSSMKAPKAPSDKSPKTPSDRSRKTHKSGKDPKASKDKSQKTDKAPKSSKPSKAQKESKDKTSKAPKARSKSPKSVDITPKAPKTTRSKSPLASRSISPKGLKDRSSKSINRSDSPLSPRGRSTKSSRSKSPKTPRSGSPLPARGRSRSNKATRSKSPKSPRSGSPLPARDRSLKARRDRSNKTNGEDKSLKSQSTETVSQGSQKSNGIEKKKALTLFASPLPPKSYLSRGTQKRCYGKVSKEIDQRQINIKESLANLLCDDEKSIHRMLIVDDEESSKDRTRSSSLPKRSGSDSSRSEKVENTNVPTQRMRRPRRHSIIGSSPSDIAKRCPADVIVRPRSTESLMSTSGHSKHSKHSKQ